MTPCRPSQEVFLRNTSASATWRASASVKYAWLLRTATTTSAGPVPFRYSCAVNLRFCTARYVSATPSPLGTVSVPAVADSSDAKTMNSELKICSSNEGGTSEPLSIE